MKKLTLSEVQYNVVLQAIKNAQAELIDQTFIDPYSEDADKYTADELMNALTEVEALIDVE